MRCRQEGSKTRHVGDRNCRIVTHCVQPECYRRIKAAGAREAKWASLRWLCLAIELRTCNLHAAVLGSVLGCLSICTDVPDKDALWLETTAHAVDNFSYWHNNCFYDIMCIAILFLSCGGASRVGVVVYGGVKPFALFLGGVKSRALEESISCTYELE
jgi:hypothetical protein